MAQLREFYRAVNRNVKGISRDPWFTIERALCDNLVFYRYHKGIPYKEGRRLSQRMQDQFKQKHGTNVFPFNKDGMNQKYNTEFKNKTFYKNPLRLQWIKDHI